MGNNGATQVDSEPRAEEEEKTRGYTRAPAETSWAPSDEGRRKRNAYGAHGAGAGAHPAQQGRQKVKLSEVQADFFNSRSTFVYRRESVDDVLPNHPYEHLQISSTSRLPVDAISSVSLVVGLNYIDTVYPLQGAHADADLFSQALEKLGFHIRRGSGSTVDFFAALDEFAAEITTGRITRDTTICIGFFGHTTQVGDADALVFTDALLTEANLRHAISRPEFECAQITIILDTSLVWSSSSHEYKWPPRDTHLRPPPPSRAFAKRFVPFSKVRLRPVGPSIFTHPHTPVDLIAFTPSATVNQNAIELVASDNVVRGAFTFALCKVLREKLRLDGSISYESLLLAVREQLWVDVGEIHQPTLTATKAASVTRPYLNFAPTTQPGPSLHFACGKIASQTTESFGSHGVSGDSRHSTCSSSGRQGTQGGEDSVRRRGEYQDYEHSIRPSDHSYAPSEYSRRDPVLSQHGHYEYEDHQSIGGAPSPSHHSARTGALRGSQSMRDLQRKNSNLEPRAFQKSSPAHYPRYDPVALASHTNGSIYSLNQMSRLDRDSPYEVDHRHDQALTTNGSIYSLNMSRQDKDSPYEIGRNSTYGSDKENYYYRDVPRCREQPTGNKLVPGGAHGGGSQLDALPPPPPPVTYLDHTM